MRALGAGTLETERFERWVRQDYLFLVEYCRLLALAAARSPDVAVLRRFAELLGATAGREMDLHRSFAGEFGVSEEALEAEEMAPVTQAYTDFLVRTAATGDFSELVAALLPCMWGFNEIGVRLAEQGLPQDPRCAKWIEAYADPEFGHLAEWCRELLDGVAADAGPRQRERMRRAFLLSSRYELAFWSASWREETPLHQLETPAGAEG